MSLSVLMCHLKTGSLEINQKSKCLTKNCMDTFKTTRTCAELLIIKNTETEVWKSAGSKHMAAITIQVSWWDYMKLNSTHSILCATINFISPKEKYVRNEDTTSQMVAVSNVVSFLYEWIAADRNHDWSSIPSLNLLI